MTGIPVAQYTFKRSDQMTTLQSKSSVCVDGQPIHVDPELLLQYIIVASNASDQVTTLQSKSSVRVDGQPIHVDLFQRLIVASNASDDRKASSRFGSL